MTIRRRLWLSVMALLGFVLLGNGLVVLGVETRELHRSLVRESRTFALLAAPQVLRLFGEGAMRSEDPSRTKERLSAIAEGLPSLAAFALVSDRGKILLKYPEEAPMPPVDFALAGVEGEELYRRDGRTGSIELVTPLHGREGSPQLYFQLLVSEEPVKARLFGLAGVYTGSFLLLLALGAFLASRIAGSILAPLVKLKSAALLIKEGDLSARAPEAGAGEISDLARAFNAMAREVESHRDKLEESNEALTRAYAELQAMQGELVSLERMAAVGRTAAAVSHEIDNPIGIILGTVQMMREELPAGSELYKDAELIEEECKRCRRIVRDLLDLARPGAGKCTAVDLSAVTELVLRGLSHHPSFRRIEFRTRFPDDLPPVFADVDGVKQVLLNLLLNAAKAMDGEGVIELEAEAGEGLVRLAILDSGPGIPEENLEKIFEPFFTTASGKDGSGLGLSVSRRIVEEQGGRLRAANRPEKGGAFYVELPTEC
jgi:signal transduction histidine kinase